MIENRFEKIYTKVISELEQGLPNSFVYHNANHTKYVLDKAEKLAHGEEVAGMDLELIKFGALYHDVGFLVDRADHESHGCQIAIKDLGKVFLSTVEVEKICGMIKATKLPQRPQNKLECIIADADLFYLGTAEYVETSQKLFLELKHFDPSIGNEEWLKIQIDFLSSHSFHTKYGKEVLEPIKQKNLEALVV
jgi:uncharacterized protein